jgi:hypothetical protein
MRASESTERVSVSLDQFALALMDVRECAEAVNLQFVNELIGVERLGTAGKPDRTQISW